MNAWKGLQNQEKNAVFVHKKRTSNLLKKKKNKSFNYKKALN